MSKLHFLFIMLNMSQVNVVKKGIITGIITKLEFVKKRKEEQKIKRREQRHKKKLKSMLYAADHNKSVHSFRGGMSGSHENINVGLLDNPPQINAVTTSINNNAATYTID